MTTNLFYFPHFEVVYINNPKAACTTLKRSLSRTKEDEISGGKFHKWVAQEYGMDSSDYSKLPTAVPILFISRDPVKRAVSGYLDKIFGTWTGGESRQRIKQKLTKELGKEPDDAISFDEYLDYLQLKILDEGRAINQHFGLQITNLEAVGLQPTHVFKLETLNGDLAALNSQRSTQIEICGHYNRTKNNKNRKLTLDDSQLKRLCTIFEQDLKRFNYADSYTEYLAP